jgi:hypothetical protein
MAGIIIYIPQAPLINPTSEIMPVNNSGAFVDSNIKNVIGQKIETLNGLFDQIGLKLDFTNNIYEIGDPLGLNIKLDTGPNELSINGVLTSTPAVVPDKFLKILNNGDVYYIQLNVEL